MITRYFSGVRDGHVEHEGDAVKVILNRDGSTLTVAWSQVPAPATVSIAAQAASGLLLDKYGNQRPIEAVNGAYQLSLDPATANTANDDPSVYLIGGNPLIIVEGSWDLPVADAPTSTTSSQSSSSPKPSPNKRR